VRAWPTEIHPKSVPGPFPESKRTSFPSRVQPWRRGGSPRAQKQENAPSGRAPKVTLAKGHSSYASARSSGCAIFRKIAGTAREDRRNHWSLSCAPLREPNCSQLSWGLRPPASRPAVRDYLRALAPPLSRGSALRPRPRRARRDYLRTPGGDLSLRGRKAGGMPPRMEPVPRPEPSPQTWRRLDLFRTSAPEVPTPGPGPLFHPESFFDGPGARRGPPEAENNEKPPS